MILTRGEVLSISLLLFGIIVFAVVKLIYWNGLLAKHEALKDFDSKRFDREKELRLIKVRYGKNKGE